MPIFQSFFRTIISGVITKHLPNPASNTPFALVLPPRQEILGAAVVPVVLSLLLPVSALLQIAAAAARHYHTIYCYGAVSVIGYGIAVAVAHKGLVSVAVGAGGSVGNVRGRLVSSLIVGHDCGR